MRGFNHLQVMSSSLRRITAATLSRGFLTQQMLSSNLTHGNLDENGKRKEGEENEKGEEKVAAARKTFRSKEVLCKAATPSSLQARPLPYAKGEPTEKERNASAFFKGNMKKKVEENNPLRYTPPSALVNDVRYFTGPHAQRWIEHFHHQHHISTITSEGKEAGWRFLAPSYRCPLCFSKKSIFHRKKSQLASYKRRRKVSSSWMTPEALTNHLSWLHPHEGCAPQEFAAFNAHVVKCIVARQRAILYASDDKNNDKHIKNKNKFAVERENSSRGDDERVQAAVAVEGSVQIQLPSSSLSCSSPPLSPFELILLVDVANLELNSSPVVLELLTSREARVFFSAIPIAFCMIHEIFIPHTAKTPHGFFRLSQLHPNSDLFTYYAVSRLESGDMGISSLIAELKIGLDACLGLKNHKADQKEIFRGKHSSLPPPLLPPMVILTMDKHLKASLTTHYGDGGGDEKLFSMLVDASESELLSSAIQQFLGRSEVKLYVPRALSAFQILRTLRLLKKGHEVLYAAVRNKMLRRTSSSLFRRTSPRLSGGELYHPPKLEEIPPSSSTRGFFCTYNGTFKFFRLVDIKWLMNRSVEMKRENYIAAPIFYLFLWMFCWKGFQILKYGDGAPPLEVDWNTKETGYLSKGFEPTKVLKKI